MTTRPTAELRRQVVERASNCCEYCLLHQDLVAFTHQVDHVIGEKHRGQTSLDNLALSCTVCNRRKGSDIGSIDPQTGNLVSLFNPRTQQWVDHFRLDGVHIVGLTEVGRATVEFLQLNAFERLIERDALIRANLYPPQRTAG
jgi:HNH endonuclease